jgi:hypothetical protein
MRAAWGLPVVLIVLLAALFEGKVLAFDEKGTVMTGSQASEGVEADNKQVVRRLFLEYINPGILELLPEVIAADYEGPREQRERGSCRGHESGGIS